MKDIKITMEDDTWMEKTGGYAKDMTLRDYFAAKALQGLLANPKLANEILKRGGALSGWIEESAWALGNEMLKARET